MRTILFLLLSIIAIQVSAQQWTENLPNDKDRNELNFYDYQKAFYDYWAPYNLDRHGYYMENGVKKKASGWKQFKRWEWSMTGQINQTTGAFPKKSAQKIYTEFLRTVPQKIKSRNANWTNLGPNSSDGGYAGVGRLAAVAFHPTDNNTYWVGAPAGGLWKTTDNGNTWTCLTDNNDVLGVSDIIIPSDYNASHTIYIATGDRDEDHNTSIGVLKSTDSGANWFSTGLSYNISENKKVYRILIDPNNNQTLLAATTDGVYKTTNGGTTWNTKLSNTRFNDLEVKTTDFNTIYGSTYNGFIHVTTDGGANWNITPDYGGRVELAVSPANANYVYAIVANNNQTLKGIYKSTDSGTNFIMVYDGSLANHNMLGYAADGHDAKGQANYDLCIAVSPTNVNTVLIGGINVWRSTDGGTNFNSITHWVAGAQVVHADQHMLNYRSNGDVFLCNDGGIYYSSNNGTQFIDKTDGIEISQMYKIGVSRLTVGEIITGLQDNGSKLLSGGTWTDVTGGDGMECIIDYTSDDIQYSTLYNGELYRTDNHWGSHQTVTPGAAGSGAWVTPYIIHPTNHATLYGGFSEVWKTTNKGNSWTKISHINPGTIKSMAISSVGDTIYIATDNAVWKTTNDGTAWTNVTNNLPPNNITSITVKFGNANVVWVTLGDYDNNGVYESIDGGATWNNISLGLPKIPVYTIVQNKLPLYHNHLYIGTQIGVFFKNGEDNWIPYNDGLPNVRIGELEIYYDQANSNQSKLVSGTFGRGLWQSSIEIEDTDIPAIITLNPTMITSNSAQVGGKLIYGGSSAVTERGIVWSTTQNPTTANNKIIDISTATGSYTAVINGLIGNTTYYYRAYAINASGTTYGSNKTFKTLCDALNTFPITEGFEGGTLPNCWSYEGENWTYENGGHNSTGPDNAHGGVFNALYYYPSTTPKVSKLITPPINLEGTPLAKMTFWHTQQKWSNDQDELRVYYKTSFEGLWTLLKTYTNNIAEWKQDTITLPNLSATYYIGFEATTKYGHGVAIDDIAIYNGEIPCIYCPSSGSTEYPTSITLVNFNSINNTTAKPAGYNDYKSISTDLKLTNSYDMTVNINTGGDYTVHSRVWIDWNQDCDFDDTGEQYELGTVINNSNTATSASPLSISIPANAKLGNTTMRVSCKYNASPTPCQSGFDGEVEDYTIKITPNTLPIELVYFTAIMDKNNKVLLEWETKNELYNDFFTIQRKKEGLEWQDIITIDANTEKHGIYTATDNHPFSGVSYYRLQQTDLDDRTSYSDIATIKVNGQNITIYPNPTSDYINIIGEDNIIGEISILNVLGQKINPPIKLSNKGIIEVDMTNLTKGFYFVKTLKSTSIVVKN